MLVKGAQVISCNNFRQALGIDEADDHVYDHPGKGLINYHTTVKHLI